MLQSGGFQVKSIKHVSYVCITIDNTRLIWISNTPSNRSTIPVTGGVAARET